MWRTKEKKNTKQKFKEMAKVKYNIRGLEGNAKYQLILFMYKS